MPLTRPLPWSLTPAELIAAWPAGTPLLALVSEPAHPRYGRLSLLARPGEAISVAAGATADEVRERLGAVSWRSRGGEEAAMCPGWVGYVGYELGAVLEPAAGRHRPAGKEASGWPLLELCRVEAAYCFDHQAGRWERVGDESSTLPFDDDAPMARAGAPAWLDPLTPVQPRAEVEEAIARIIEHIRVGDIYQANLTQRFRTRLHGSARSLFVRALREAPARYGALLELPEERSVVSLSPELFLEAEAATGRLITRPIKGTLPAGLPVAQLRESEKDAAELAMIVDLMRNDLGRVCEFGSVAVAEARTIETHPTVHQGVATVSGRMCEDIDLYALLEATFPPGSVTGTPKIRAMQIIDVLEPAERGVYCGAIAWVGDGGGLAMSVAIRTLVAEADGRAVYSAGGGIVADSTPAAEYEEALAKTAAISRLTHRASRT